MPEEVSLRRTCEIGLAWLAVVLAVVLPGACARRAAPTFGLTERQEVNGLAFPIGLPQPRPVQVVSAFPALVFDQPLFFGAVPDGRGRVVVAEQRGVLSTFADDAQVSAATVFLDIRHLVQAGGEEGLLGVAFHPNYQSNGQFYVYYTPVGPQRSVVARYRVSTTDPDVADPTSEEILLEFDQPFGNHNGGALAFGPDGMLYVASGDGGSGDDPGNRAQALDTLLGKILRLTPDGAVPADNPFVGGPNGARGEIWAYGLRNPWRITFDRETGVLWAGDVGQGAEEEIDIIERGANYGWRVFEGGRSNINPSGLPPSAFTQPVHSYPRSDGQSVTGGYVYRGPGVASLRGAYVYADYASGRVWALVHDGTHTVSNLEIASVSSPASFGENAEGELHVCSFDGRIYRFEDTGGGGGGEEYPATLSATGLFVDVGSLRPAPGLIEYEVNAELWADGARKRRWLALPGTTQIAFSAGEAFALPIGTVLVKHFEVDLASGGTKRLETRVLVHRTSGWEGRTYRWNTAGTDAALLADAEDETVTTRDASGAPRTHVWHYPSPNECLACHTQAAGRVLGLRAAQLNRSFAYPARADNQLRAWNHIGLFASDIGDHARYPALADPEDTAAPIAARARSYLAANCAHCHRPGGPTPVDLDLRADLDVTLLRALDVPASSPVGGDPTRLRILPGNKERSDVWERLRRRDTFAMPPLGSALSDPLAEAVIGAWIDAGAR